VRTCVMYSSSSWFSISSSSTSRRCDSVDSIKQDARSCQTGLLARQRPVWDAATARAAHQLLQRHGLRVDLLETEVCCCVICCQEVHAG
jgi:hypothetical protein